MTDHDLTPAAANGGDSNLTNIIYILYLVGIAVGITTIVGVIMAYVNDGAAPAWLRSHYRYQIRTFWIGMLYGLLGTLLSLVGIGLLVFPLLLIWWIVRCVKGMRALGDRRGVDNPAAWLF
jgi:uncharacterized membrane protein